MTVHTSSWADVPSAPAVYAMYGGERPRTWVAYVGIAGNLQGRLIQHFVRRDSSVVTGSSAVGVNIDLVTHVNWWEDQSFSDDDHRHAAEMVAFDVLDPALRSRGNTRRTARELAADPDFRDAMSRLFAGQPSGQFVSPRLGQVAMDVPCTYRAGSTSGAEAGAALERTRRRLIATSSRRKTGHGSGRALIVINDPALPRSV